MSDQLVFLFDEVENDSSDEREEGTDPGSEVGRQTGIAVWI